MCVERRHESRVEPFTIARPYTYRDTGALWGTLEGVSGQRDPKLSTTRSKADVSHWKMRVGTDMGWSVGDKGDLVLGVFGHYGEGETKVHSALTDDGQIEQRTFGLGASLTWYAANGFYADGQLHYNHVSSRLYATKTGTTRLSKVNAGGLAGGLEAGYRIGRGRYAVIPQAQLSYSELGWDDFRLGTMSVADGEAKSLKGRLGLALSRQTVGENGKASHLYGVVNLHKAFEGKSAIWVSGTPVRSDPETLWGEIGADFTHNLNPRTSLFAEGGYRAALSHGGDNYSLNGRIGFRMALGGGNHPHK